MSFPHPRLVPRLCEIFSIVLQKLGDVLAPPPGALRTWHSFSAFQRPMWIHVAAVLVQRRTSFSFSTFASSEIERPWTEVKDSRCCIGRFPGILYPSFHLVGILLGLLLGSVLAMMHSCTNRRVTALIGPLQANQATRNDQDLWNLP